MASPLKGRKNYPCLWGCGKAFKTVAAAVKHSDKCPKKGTGKRKYVIRPKDME